MNLQWFNISMDTPIRQIGWTYVFLVVCVGFVAITYIRLYEEGFRIRIGPNDCEHRNARCLHGDEILARMKVYSFRFWKPTITNRQVCLDCGEALDRSAICTTTGKDCHTWSGSWHEGTPIA